MRCSRRETAKSGREHIATYPIPLFLPLVDVAEKVSECDGYCYSYTRANARAQDERGARANSMYARARLLLYLCMYTYLRTCVYMNTRTCIRIYISGVRECKKREKKYINVSPPPHFHCERARDLREYARTREYY